MITTERWKKNVIDSVESVADRHFQESTWFGNHKTLFSNPNEVYCQLFDDNDFEDFIVSEQIDLSAEQKVLGHALIVKMKAFSARLGKPLTPSKVLGDPQWDEIRTAAKLFLRALTKGEVL